MSIASEITRLYGVRGDIFTAITNKGVTVPSGSQLDDAPTLIASISSGGGAYTLNYTNPNQYCTFGTNPDCARSGTTITPVYTLTNNYILDNLTLNGNNIQGSSFSMPATNSTVGMVVRQINPVHFKIYGTSWSRFTMMNLKLNGQTPTILYGTQCNYSHSTPVALSSGDINLICDQYSPFQVNWSEQWTSYIDVAFDITSFDPTTNYITWDVNYSYIGISDLTAIVYIGNTTLATLTYDQPSDGNSHTFRIPEEDELGGGGIG